MKLVTEANALRKFHAVASITTIMNKRRWAIWHPLVFTHFFWILTKVIGYGYENGQCVLGYQIVIVKRA